MVQILLSTYNGSVFLQELLDSLAAQSFENIAITIRDDNSVDTTLEILKTFAANNPDISVFAGDRKKAKKSFFYLLNSVSDAEYYAFCDQDDFWYTDKIDRAINNISKTSSEIPALYFSRLEYVNVKLQLKGFSREPRKAVSFQNALVENMATGCTMVINKAARELIIQHLPENCIMHDWWCLLVVSAFGEIIYDATPGVKYRLHDNNAVGAPLSFAQDFKRRVRRLGGEYDPEEWIYAQAKEFQRLYKDILPKEKSEILQKFIDSRKSWLTRLKYAFSADVYRQRWFDSVILRLLIIFNRY
ncbi:MAG: glycosyltransferase family 2 protein [Gammaproteobacteria bacterium]